MTWLSHHYFRRKTKGPKREKSRVARPKRPSFAPALETLEDRLVLSTGVTVPAGTPGLVPVTVKFTDQPALAGPANPLDEDVTISFNNVQASGVAGQFATTINGQGQPFYAMCIDLFHDVFPGETYNVLPISTPNAQSSGLVPNNAGEVAYLYNHFNSAFGSPLSPEAGAALQVAIWELEYGPNFSLVSATNPITHLDETSKVLSDANALVAIAAGQSEAATYFEPAASNAPTGPGQGLIGNCGTGPQGMMGLSAVQSNFNAGIVPANSYIWFQSVLNTSNLPKNQQVTLRFVNATITFSGTGKNSLGKTVTVNETVNVPDATVIFSPTATTASTTFDPVTNSWITIVPSSGLSGNVFLDGLAFHIDPTQFPGGFPGGIQNVTWQGTFVSDTQNIGVNWQWAAAVYDSGFLANPNNPDYNSLGVKPVDDSHIPIVDNGTPLKQSSDHAGTPESVLKHFVGNGARGGGGSNFTGSYSSTGHATAWV